VISTTVVSKDATKIPSFYGVRVFFSKDATGVPYLATEVPIPENDDGLGIS
jgi:hypothetical protein